ncbi:hypothetical protein BDP81DRAFT_436759 [Colletotrichum phormii]|uniref:Uncharacterized protein n=1 Tax=Colletotrichum phormii TaxID=359342 RepID=A0AAI9ZHZ3_9PEZI|nr:uncharacterized protein BDP81DRAFT_436759 [Colletotrichum phormii]KAK1624927.1 hypothetical protein BDP81DRAFT_436759 [Colletotrichum phormii]
MELKTQVRGVVFPWLFLSRPFLCNLSLACFFLLAINPFPCLGHISGLLDVDANLTAVPTNSALFLHTDRDGLAHRFG